MLRRLHFTLYFKWLWNLIDFVISPGLILKLQYFPCIRNDNVTYGKYASAGKLEIYIFLQNNFPERVTERNVSKFIR